MKNLVWKCYWRQRKRECVCLFLRVPPSFCFSCLTLLFLTHINFNLYFHLFHSSVFWIFASVALFLYCILQTVKFLLFQSTDIQVLFCKFHSIRKNNNSYLNQMKISEDQVLIISDPCNILYWIMNRVGEDKALIWCFSSKNRKFIMSEWIMITSMYILNMYTCIYFWTVFCSLASKYSRKRWFKNALFGRLRKLF